MCRVTETFFPIPVDFSPFSCVPAGYYAEEAALRHQKWELSSHHPFQWANDTTEPFNPPPLTEPPRVGGRPPHLLGNKNYDHSAKVWLNLTYKAFRHVENLFIQGVCFILQARYWLALFRQPIASLYNKNKHLG